MTVMAGRLTNKRGLQDVPVSQKQEYMNLKKKVGKRFAGHWGKCKGELGKLISRDHNHPPRQLSHSCLLRVATCLSIPQKSR